jgi:hypothetical protein
MTNLSNIMLACAVMCSGMQIGVEPSLGQRHDYSTLRSSVRSIQSTLNASEATIIRAAALNETIPTNLERAMTADVA